MDQFQYNLAEVFLLWTSIKIFQAIVFSQKTWLQGGKAFFPYISIWKKLKIFLSETTWLISK